ncbi:ParA family protein [Salinibacter ruber]|jgi:chromosome partitioning protein|uniref:Chromosome partitioning protein n=1 Tax=Salinibacter ruber TaxID=146919 RepID=A0A9X2ZN44_9BACT|nr:ParA family protein [Salinibacter ruber]MCS3860000.1 chromosome partitioning protein [Salinibacter ruber]MCS3866830.1 chromosome partitioning protein [Salinibacter ruber]MCS4191276.1 chromosome partitioning protein [Salinibacter ruber]MCS4198202.1 chromosome partitioning protein [Salinibacter ruber]
MSVTVSLINNKGGVGKTTTAIHLADGSQREDNDVLLIDLDAQGSASLALGCDSMEPSIGAVLYDDVDPREVIRTPPGSEIDLITGASSLKNADIRLSQEYGREQLLTDALDPLEDQYDMILLDCPPSLSLLPVNAIVASDYFVVPVEPEYLALEGIGSLLDTTREIREGIGTAAELLGIVVAQADFRANSTGQIIEILREEHGEAVFDTVIRGNVRVSEAASYGVPVYEHAPSSTGAKAYSDLTEEFLHRLQ